MAISQNTRELANGGSEGGRAHFPPPRIFASSDAQPAAPDTHNDATTQDLAAMAPALAPSSPSRAGGSTNGMSPHAGYPQLPPGGYPSPGGGAAHHNPMMMGAGAPPAYTLGYGGGYPPAVPTALASGSGYVPAQ